MSQHTILETLRAAMLIFKQLFTILLIELLQYFSSLDLSEFS